jgi:hypothetical protein
MSTAPFLATVCRGLVGHVSYLATCSLSTVYSEYLLYEPMARIAQAKGYSIRCEVPVGPKTTIRGDHRRIDFLLIKDDHTIALEVKWVKKKKSRNVTNDVEKLRLTQCDERFLLAFGRGDVFERLKLKANRKVLTPSGSLVRWKAGMTDYAARWFRV